LRPPAVDHKDGAQPSDRIEMPVSIAPIDELVPDAAVEDQVLLRAIRACILPPRYNRPRQIPSAIDWGDVGRVAAANKMGMLLLRGLSRSGGDVPPDFRSALEEQQEATIRLNTRNLMTLRLVVSALKANEVESVVLKGPCAQMLLHGDFFAKPSSDVDLLVSRRDFGRAGRIIADCGFAVADECRSPWWTVFLGEQHFLAASRTLTTVDLHHRTQQPGCPAPNEAGAFLSSPASVMVGGMKVPTLSRSDTILLACMSLVKALVHKEPAGGHVCDIAAGLAGHAPEEVAQLAREADRRGLRNTLGLGLRSARLLLGLDARMDKVERTVMEDVADADLLDMILRPWSSGIRWHRRSRMLWDLCDNKSAFLKEICWKIGAELCYTLLQRPRRDRALP
jgi:hypothetical protein